MKTTIKILAFLFLLINFGCSNYYDELQNAGFTNPTIKNQPRLLYPKAAQENSFSGKTENRAGGSGGRYSGDQPR